MKTKEQRKGTLIIENFENLMYTDDLNCNMIMNLLTDQLERCKGICTVIYGKKDVILADTGVKEMSKLHQMYSGTVKCESGVG